MAKRKMEHKTTWREFEDAIYNILYYRYRPPAFEVHRDIRKLRGRYSEVLRQIDVGVYRMENPARPFIAAECKFYKRKLHVKDVEAYIGMLEDIGAEEGILVSLKGFARSAHRRASTAPLTLVTLPLEDAERVNWRKLARQVFPGDEAFHEQMGDAFYALDTTDDMDEYVETLEGLPFEEWETVLNSYAGKNTDRCISALRAIAADHPDDAWRFNAVRILQDSGALDEELRTQLLEAEWDLETIELLAGGSSKQD